MSKSVDNFLADVSTARRLAISNDTDFSNGKNEALLWVLKRFDQFLDEYNKECHNDEK